MFVKDHTIYNFMIQCVFYTQETPMPTYHEYLIKAKKAYDNKQWVNALTSLDSIEQNDTFTDAQKLEACKLRTGIIVKQKSLAKTTKKKRAFEMALLEAFMLQDWYTLLTSSETITHYQPDLSEQLFIAGEHYYSQGKNAEACSTYQAVLALNPHHWRAAQQCMKIYFDAQQYEAMTPICETVIARIPRDTQINNDICFHAHYYLATAYLAQEMLEPATMHCLKADEISPQSTIVMLKLGEIAKIRMYAHHQHYTLNMHSIFNADNQKLTLLRTDFAAQSIHYFESVLKGSAEHLEAHTALAEIHLYRHNLDKAMQHLTHLLRLDEKNSFIYQCKIAQITVENKEYATSLRYFRTILAMPEFNQIPSVLQSDLYFACGVIHEKMQNYNEAIKHYTLALTRDFRNMPACFASERLVKAKFVPATHFTHNIPNPENALSIFSVILNSPGCAPASKAYLIGLCAHVYAKLKNIELALSCYQWADTISPNGPVELAAVAQLSKLKDMRTTHSNLVQLNLFQGKEQPPETTLSLTAIKFSESVVPAKAGIHP